MTKSKDTIWPQIRNAGFDGFLVSFADRLSEPANRAALAFRDAVERAGWDAVEESAATLVSTFLRFDPLGVDHASLRRRIEELLSQQDWYGAELPEGRKLWRVPTCYEGDCAPQLAEAATAAGLSPDDAVRAISQTRVRVQTIGFAPGMPYLGVLPPEWDIPRQTGLTARVPAGGLCVAIRQLVLFPVDTPTGWRQIGQTAFRLFRPESSEPFVLRPGDEVEFTPVDAETMASLRDAPDGGAVSEAIR